MRFVAPEDETRQSVISPLCEQERVSARSNERTRNSSLAIRSTRAPCDQSDQLQREQYKTQRRKLGRQYYRREGS